MQKDEQMSRREDIDYVQQSWSFSTVSVGVKCLIGLESKWFMIDKP